MEADLQKYDTYSRTRQKWNKSVLRYADAYMKRYTGQTDKSLERVAEVRKRCYPRLRHGDVSFVSRLPEWEDFIPGDPRHIDEVLEIFESQVAKYQGWLTISQNRDKPGNMPYLDMHEDMDYNISVMV